MYIPDFNYHTPKSLEEACGLLEKSDDGALIAGGTDLLVEIKQGLRSHQDIISLKSIDEIKEISVDAGNLIIGAGVTHNELIASAEVLENCPALAEAASTIGTDQIRNTGTIGGNLCTGASCCDIAPVLIACGASVILTNSSEERTLLLKDFFNNHKETNINKGEILTKISIPKPEHGTGAGFEKFGLRETASISVASAAAMVKLDNDSCVDACVVIGAVAPIPMISPKATETINGASLADISEGSDLLKQVGEAAADDSLPIDDIRGSAEYRRNLIKVLTERAILKAVGRART